MNLDGTIDEPSSYMFCQTVQYKDCKEDKDPEKMMLDSRASHTMIFYQGHYVTFHPCIQIV
jgi:hypothetical protein